MCERIDVPLYNLIPPLRLVLNSNCNGNCSFCHHEGDGTNSIMDPILIYECADIAEQMKIPHISLTGGEPTLRADLAALIEGIQSRYSGKISLTTNGFGLSDLSKWITTPIHTVNLSMISFREDVYKKYQNVEPYGAIESLISFSTSERNLNIVVVEENFRNIKEIAEYSLSRSLSLHVMFELKKYSQADIEMQDFVIRELRKLGQAEMRYGTTPALIIKAGDSAEISIKHPRLSKGVKWSICDECDVEDSCFERVCAVRVYPNGTVTPCLNGHISYSEGSMTKKVARAYNMFTQQNLVSVENVPFLCELVALKGDADCG